jgi:serine/threonine protein kinase
MSKRWRQIEQLFHSCRSVPFSQRDEFLSEHCGGDQELLEEVQSLLQSDLTPDGFVDHPERASEQVAQQFCQVVSLEDCRVGRIGPYQVQRFLAAGGMGMVYEAVEEQSQRTVALKIMRYRLSASARRRFQYEVQILSRLNHPGIAQIYSAGVHAIEPAGLAPLHVPYFAMELVEEARTLHHYALEHSLSRRQRIELFLQVCAAVHHGHQKGIIHRDLKPANILVDQQGQVKIIDFGVARAAPAPDSGGTLLTESGQLIGTLQYMSPEQVDAGGTLVDTRSDLYSLGVILYELLLGNLPYELPRDELIRAAVIVREQDPARPSTVDSSCRGDLEVILLKALRKEPGDRYASAAEFERDLQNYLEGEPISARAPQWTDLLRRLARRHRWAAAAILIAISALIIGAAGTSLGYWRAVQAAEEARQEATATQAMFDFLSGMLQSANPRHQGPDVRVVDLLDQAALTLPDSFPDRPLSQAKLQSIIGSTYHQLGWSEQAAPQLRQSLKALREFQPTHRETLATMFVLAGVLLSFEQTEEAEELAAEAVELWRHNHDTTDRKWPAGLAVLARIQLDLGNFDVALKNLEEGLALQERYGRRLSEETVLLLSLRSVLAEYVQNQDDAIHFAEQTVAVAEETLHQDHPALLAAQLRLSITLESQGKLRRAEELLSELVESSKRIKGPLNSDTLFMMRELGTLQAKAGRPEEAEQLLLEVLELQRQHFGEFHWESFLTKAFWGDALRRQQKPQEAEDLLREAMDGLLEEYGRSQAATWEVANLLATALAEAGEGEALEEFILAQFEAGEPSRASFSVEHHQRRLRRQLINYYSAKGRSEEVRRHLKILSRSLCESLGASHPRTRAVQFQLEQLSESTSKAASLP